MSSSATRPTSPTKLQRVTGAILRTPTSQAIYFYDYNKPHYGFTNFSPHPVNYGGKVYPTSEHLFQAFKFLKHRPDLAEIIRTAPRPREALEEARRFQDDVRLDWLDVSIRKMEEVLWVKFNQHPQLEEELIQTGDAELIEDSPVDSFWGCGADRKGNNHLGKLLMKVRQELKDQRVALSLQCGGRPPQPVASTSGAGPLGQYVPASATSSGPDLCVFCRQKPKFPPHPYCGKRCATTAAAAGVAHQQPTTAYIVTATQGHHCSTCGHVCTGAAHKKHKVLVIHQS